MTPIRRPYLSEKSAKEPSRLWALLVRVSRSFIWFVWLAVCAAATAVLFKLAYPKPSYSLLMWLALAPFTLAVVRARSFWGSVFYGWFCGTLVFAGLYQWVFITCLDGGGLGYALSAAAWLGLSANLIFLGIYIS